MRCSSDRWRMTTNRRSWILMILKCQGDTEDVLPGHRLGSMSSRNPDQSISLQLRVRLRTRCVRFSNSKRPVDGRGGLNLNGRIINGKTCKLMPVYGSPMHFERVDDVSLTFS
jgi:hypothetical protein